MCPKLPLPQEQAADPAGDEVASARLDNDGAIIMIIIIMIIISSSIIIISSSSST